MRGGRAAGNDVPSATRAAGAGCSTTREQDGRIIDRGATGAPRGGARDGPTRTTTLIEKFPR